MYLSRLLINTGVDPNRPDWNISRRWLRNLYRVHQRLCMAFPSASRRRDDPHFLKPFRPDDFAQNHVHIRRAPGAGFLFRIDPLPKSRPHPVKDQHDHCGVRAMILVQSAVEPNWEYAFHNACHLLAARPQCKAYEPSFEKDEKLRFRLLANPTRRLSPRSVGPDGRPVQHGVGKRVPVPADRLASWLTRRGDDGGFAIEEDSLVLQPGYAYVRKNKNESGQRLRSCRYEGVLTVTDPAKFQRVIVQGIGPAKAFGFGLLSVARWEG